MDEQWLLATYVGGPTVVLELSGLRFLTDPTFDPAGSEYPAATYTLRKTQGPAVAAEALGTIDAVLLSHDHHADNLDRSGRDVLRRAGVVLTTPAGAGRVGPPAVGLAPWQTHDLAGRGGRRLRVIATPARHGPVGGDRGPVTGFVLVPADRPDGIVYVSGDTVWYEGVAEVARRFRVAVAVLSLGAARVRQVGPDHLTFDARDAVEAARAFPTAVIAPLHYEGWEHFSEGRADIERAFDAAGESARLCWLPPGRPTVVRSRGRSPPPPVEDLSALPCSRMSREVEG